MTMDKRGYLSLCLASFFLMAGAAFVMWSRWESLSAAVPAAKPILPEEFNEPLPTPAVPAEPDPVPQAPAVPAKRNIRFTYRNSRPARVDLVGSFNGWSPAPLTKGANFVWEITVPLLPGEHAYNFLVDGKPVRDPNNPRTAPEGRSLLVISPPQ